VAEIDEIVERLERIRKRTKNREDKAELGRIEKELRALFKEPSPAMSPLDVANAFRQVVEQVQTEAREAPGVATTIKSLDLEVKAFVQVDREGETALAFPRPDAEVDASALSTLRVSFGAIPSALPPEQQQQRRR
jgi:hypothetical protein